MLTLLNSIVPAVIVAIVIVVLLLIALVVILCLYLKRRQNETDAEIDDILSTEYPAAENESGELKAEDITETEKNEKDPDTNKDEKQDVALNATADIEATNVDEIKAETADNIEKNDAQKPGEYTDLTRAELFKMCKDRNLSVNSRTVKADLIKALEDDDMKHFS